ncbi:MAG: gluconate 2-dehydrogenase subunit 3 family protein [Gammaproteobacteria bacterium]|nr:gluconate 2-dehydrogenase subunit 3 family protein [Gammaproteobacteria bacterium]
MKRRALLAGAGGLAAAVALWKFVPRERSGDRSAGAAAGPAAPPAAADPLLERLCDLVIPDTDTPGARAAGVPAFIALALEHGLAGASPQDRATLQQRLDQRAGGAFLQLDAARQAQVLAPLDAATLTRDPAAATAGEPAWARIKQLIVMGYYTSEAGASRELRYQPVPGRWDPDVPFKPGERESSTNWVGQTF